MNDQQCFEELAKSICEFYITNRDVCTQQYNMAESPEINSLYETIEDKRKINLLFSKVSAVILTANKYEKNILHTNLYHATNQKIQRIEINLLPRREFPQTTYAYYFNWHNYNILHIEAQHIGSYTIGGSADLVRYVRENPFLYPTTIISLGICFGTQEKKQSLGDTIISEKIYPYFIGAKWGENSFYVTDDNMFRINHRLRTKIKTEVLDLNLLNNAGFKTYLGNFVTGEAVISNKEVRDRFVGITREPISGGEMEGYGLFKECCGGDNIIPCILIKAICDWGVLKNLTDIPSIQNFLSENGIIDNEELVTIKDRIQSCAAYNAYRVLDVLLKNCIFYKSIYDQVKPKIAKKYERVVQEWRVKKYAEEIINEIIGDLPLSDRFITAMCDAMAEDGFLSSFDDATNNASNVWRINK